VLSELKKSENSKIARDQQIEEEIEGKRKQIEVY
jgi:hypothetical protein